MRQILAVVCLLTVGCAHVSFADQSPQQEAQALFERAAAVSRARNPQFAPYRLVMRFQLLEEDTKSDGTYEETWSAPQQWRKQISGSDFSETIGSNNGKVWL
jgi:hypothetical protein